MMEAVRTSETSVDNQFTRQYNPEDSSEQNTKLSTTKQKCDLHAYKYDRFWQSFLEAAVSSYDPYQHS